MLEWRIYYSDGATFCNEQGGPEDAPPFGVAIIVQRDPQIGRALYQGYDYFYWDGSVWGGCDNFGLIDRLAHRLPTRAVCVGRMIAPLEWAEICRKATDDPSFPRKSARASYETPRSAATKWRDV